MICVTIYNSDCTIQWFHCDCLRIRNPPKGQWYCHQGSIVRKRANNNTAVIIEIILFSHSSHKIINHCHMTQKYYNLILGNNRWAEINYCTANSNNLIYCYRGGWGKVSFYNIPAVIEHHGEKRSSSHPNGIRNG